VTLVGLDDTDSRERGMCTTYVTARVAEAIESAGGSVDRRLLIRLNPAVEFKTRGNAALCLETDLDPSRAFDIATATVGVAGSLSARTPRNGAETLYSTM